MNNIQIIQNSQGEITVIIFQPNGSFTSMLKSTYDAQVEHLTEKVTDAN